MAAALRSGQTGYTDIGRAHFKLTTSIAEDKIEGHNRLLKRVKYRRVNGKVDWFSATSFCLSC